MKFSITFSLLLLSLITFGQEKDFYDVDNSNHEIFKNNKVKSLKVYVNDYDKNGALKDTYVELVQNYAINGDLIWEKEFYYDSTAAWEVNYKYNDARQIMRTEWTWLDDNDQELSLYEYDADNNLIEIQDYYKHSDSNEFVLEASQTIHYEDNQITKVTDINNNVETIYKKYGEIIIGYSANNVLESKYKNGASIYKKIDSLDCYYEHNDLGQILKATVNYEENKTRITTYEYSNGLLTKVSTKEGQVILSESKYEYEYYE